MADKDVLGLTVAIATDDLDETISFLQDAFGLTPDEREQVDSEGIEVAIFRVNESAEIQLLQPITDGSPVAGFLEQNGPGIHHMGVFVESVRDRLSRLAAAGIRTIGDEPRPGAGGRKVGFVHPKASGGVLIELLEQRDRE